MKIKFLLSMIIILSLLVLIGCKSEPTKTLEEWVVQYTFEFYESEFDKEAIGYMVEKYSKLDVENDFDGLYQMYKVTIINCQGANIIYNVVIAYNEAPLPTFTGGSRIAESNIIDFDIERFPFHD